MSFTTIWYARQNPTEMAREKNPQGLALSCTSTEPTAQEKELMVKMISIKVMRVDQCVRLRRLRVAVDGNSKSNSDDERAAGDGVPFGDEVSCVGVIGIVLPSCDSSDCWDKVCSSSDC